MDARALAAIEAKFDEAIRGQSEELRRALVILEDLKQSVDLLVRAFESQTGSRRAQTAGLD
jgi:low affinity Fe/Cu permease